MSDQAMRIRHWSNKMAPSFIWESGTGTENGGEHDSETQNDGGVDEEHAQQRDPPVLPPIRRVLSEDDHGVELRRLSDAGSSR